LKIETFVGTSENALHIQIWTALIAILMLRFLQLSATWEWSLSNLVAMIRLNLFTYRDLPKCSMSRSRLQMSGPWTSNPH
jgi:hypothetical protein